MAKKNAKKIEVSLSFTVSVEPSEIGNAADGLKEYFEGFKSHLEDYLEYQVDGNPVGMCTVTLNKVDSSIDIPPVDAGFMLLSEFLGK